MYSDSFSLPSRGLWVIRAAETKKKIVSCLFYVFSMAPKMARLIIIVVVECKKLIFAASGMPHHFCTFRVTSGRNVRNFGTAQLSQIEVYTHSTSKIVI